MKLEYIHISTKTQNFCGSENENRCQLSELFLLECFVICFGS